MEGRNDEMEANVTMQHDDDSIWMKSDQIMEDKNEHDFEQITNQEPSLVQRTFVPTE